MALTQDEFFKIKSELDEAEKDDTPFAVVSNGEVSVIGDANKTEVKKNDYKVRFGFPKEMVPEGKGKVIDDLAYVEIEYNDVFIAPRRELQIVQVIVNLLPFFRKINEDGSVGEYTNEELVDIVTELDDEVVEKMYKLVEKVLGVNKDISEYMTILSVCDNVAKIIKNNPSTINEADVFFA